MVNGVAMANKDKVVFCLGSDGSQQEGNDAEAARLAVAKNLNVKILIDDNDVTIAGHPSEYLKGYNTGKTLEGHGLKVFRADGENIDELWSAVSELVTYDGPAALISKRVMAPGVKGIEGSPHGHDVVPVKVAIEYLRGRGYPDSLIKQIEGIKPNSNPYQFIGSTKEKEAGRAQFGTSVVKVLDKISKEEAAKKVMVIDSES
jgi:transketolase